jgi:transcriptional regulator with XRE-family HTH domain
MDQLPYYFDALPLHPQPEKLESLTSYITRLAEVNGIQTINAFVHTCFPEYQVQTIRSINDFPFSSWVHFQAAACCTEAVLQATTFYHLGKKFGRVHDSRACYNFLHNSIAPSFRYCPLCIKEKGYYSLLWRFLFIKGCSDHNCYLLDTCGHCGEEIHTYTTPLRIGLCPSCDRNIGSCRIQPLLEAEEERYSSSQELQFLLSPQPWEALTGNLAQHIGERFALLRQKEELTIREMAERAVFSPENIKGVEFDIVDTYTTPFQSYLQYSKSLGVSLRHIFNTIANKDCISLPQAGQIQNPENESIAKMQEAIKILRDRDEPITEKAIRRIAQLSNETVSQRPSLGIELQQLALAARAEQRQQAILEKNAITQKVAETITQLELAGEPVTYGSISEMISAVSISSRGGWQMIRFLNQCISQYLCEKRNIAQEEDMLLVRVEKAINQLKELDAVLTRRDIASVVRRYQKDLQQYPSIEALWRDIPEAS